jgi:hypothetical protein
MLPSSKLLLHIRRIRHTPVAILLVVLPLWYTQASPSRSVDHHLKFKRGQNTICVKGQFIKKRAEVYYTVYGHAGQHMRVEIIPLTANLNTQANIKFPSSNLEPGNPGGVVFDEKLPEDGIYRIRVGQRFNEKKVGRFMIKITRTN